MIKILGLAAFCLSMNTAFALSEPLACTMMENGWTNRLTLTPVSDTTANFVVEVSTPNSTVWSKSCWSRGEFSLVAENSWYGSYECPAIQARATITYSPASKELRFHKDQSDPKYDDVYSCP